jgi:hypothetical protein
MVALDVIITLAFSTVAIGQLYLADGDLSLDSLQASWIGKSGSWALLGVNSGDFLRSNPLSFLKRQNK